MLIPMNTWTVLKDFLKKNCLIKTHFYRSLKNRKLMVEVKRLDGHIADKEYLTCIKIWKRFNMKNMVGYDDHFLKKNCAVIS